MSSDLSLSNRYTRTCGTVLLSGTQALVRMLIEQARSDRAAGLDTAGFVSGYRGSPLGGFDQELWRARAQLDPLGIHFQPGLNEELAATAVWGSQQSSALPGALHDGVFGLWYGKGPGVDRSGDALKHANAWGTSRAGGVLAIAGDDHAAKSSSLAHQSEFALIDARMPVLHPSDAGEIIDFGLYGYALSRAAGLWVGMKLTSTVLDSAQTIDRLGSQARFVAPVNGLDAHIRWPDGPLAQEQRMVHVKLPAARAFIAANPLDRLVWAGREDRLAIVVPGKSWNDVRAALEMLGIDSRRANQIGLRLIKVSVVWPLDSENLIRLIGDAETVLVVEEKRALIETELKAAYFDRCGSGTPRVIGKVGLSGEALLAEAGELDALSVARAVRRLLEQSVELPPLPQPFEASRAVVSRTPYFCSGCPHNRSTRVPAGSIALGGIGCHSMAMHMERGTIAYTQMGGEGATWIGHAPFTSTRHVFQNLGDGTFFHSGSLAIRAAVAAHRTITFKLLVNDAVAMTGGQPIDGELGVSKIVQLLRAEGVRRIAVVTERPQNYANAWGPGADVTLHERDTLEAVQRELRDVEGVSALIFEQVCAAELRRRRKRGKAPAAPMRVLINPDVCEGCGDCGVQSNCLSIQPLETEFGTKRRIDQSSCNADYSCLKGFCPSFVTVEGEHSPARPDPIATSAELPLPVLPRLDGTYRIVVAGVGGTGVVTVGALLAAAAHIEGKASATYDMTGMAQKAGPVLSHVAIAASSEAIAGAPTPAGAARLLIGCDPIVAADPQTLSLIDRDRGAAVWNSLAVATAAFTRDPDAEADSGELGRTIASAVPEGRSGPLAATSIAREALGDTIGANLLLVGAAWQKGLIPLGLSSIEAAIRLNGVQGELNLAAFSLGRRQALGLGLEVKPAAEPTVDELINRYGRLLTAYQDAAYAQRYRVAIDAISAAERRTSCGSEQLTRAVARNLGKLMAYKDEYEVARLHLSASFAAELDRQAGKGARVRYYLAPPFLSGADPSTGRPRKRAFGRWIIPAFRLLAALRRVRGTWLDPFGRTSERKSERALVHRYLTLVERLAVEVTPANLPAAVALAAAADLIRGFGPVKAAGIAKAQAEEARLWGEFEAQSQRALQTA